MEFDLTGSDSVVDEIRVGSVARESVGIVDSDGAIFSGGGAVKLETYG